MAYSDYGSFVYMNGDRRRDKEDVGVFDTDESSLPSGVRIFANIMKNRANGSHEWYNHSHHGVMGDRNVRVACYKQGFPTIYHWKDGAVEPEILSRREIANIIGKDEEEIDCYDYDPISLDYENHHFYFVSKDNESDHYEARMTEPDGTQWECVYDYGYGAGFDD